MIFKYTTDGFQGRLFPSCGKNDGSIIFVLQGMAGCQHAAQFAELLANNNINALAFAYYGVEGLPQKPAKIPLEQFDNAVANLRRQGYNKFGLYGTSRGASTALLVGSLIPDFSCVIALSPVRYVYQGSGTKCSMYSYKNRDIPFVPQNGLLCRFVKRVFKQRKIRLLYMLEEWEKNSKKSHEIAVENINGPILLLSSTVDESMPSKRHCEEMIQRLKQSYYNYEGTHINFEQGSHNLGICSNVNTWALPREKHCPEQCQQAREQALEKTLTFISEWKT